jgi:DnaJ-domain-containing protein 1
MPLDLHNLVDAVAKGIGSLGAASPDARAGMWQDAQRFATRLLGAAADKWLPYFGEHHACTMKVLKNGVAFPCGGHAILACDACGEPACVHHVQVDQHGDGTCFGCIVEVIHKKRIARGAAPPVPPAGGPPPPSQAEVIRELVKKSLATLGLKPGATWDEIARAHRKLAADHHPDRAKSARQRKTWNDKTVAVNAAMAELRRHYGPKAVA